MKLWWISTKKKSTWKTQSFAVTFSLTHFKLPRQLPISMRFVWAASFNAWAQANTSSCKALSAHAWHKRTVMYEGRQSQSWNGAAVFIKVVRHRMEVLCSTPVLPSGYSKPYSTSNHCLVSLPCALNTICFAGKKQNTPAQEREEERGGYLSPK